jgi:hypothetical protein
MGSGRRRPRQPESRPLVIAAGPIGRDQGQRLARTELSKAIYHQESVPQLILHAIGSFLQKILDSISQATPGGGWSVLALVGLAVVIVAVIVARIGPLAGSARRATPLVDPGARPLSARQLREAAEASAAGGDYSAAILQLLRAVATSCEERGILVPEVGRTADELATQLAMRLPGHRAALAAAAGLFDQIRYGDGVGTPEGYEQLRELDAAVGRLGPGGRPVLAGGARAGTAAAGAGDIG